MDPARGYVASAVRFEDIALAHVGEGLGAAAAAAVVADACGATASASGAAVPTLADVIASTPTAGGAKKDDGVGLHRQLQLQKQLQKHPRCARRKQTTP